MTTLDEKLRLKVVMALMKIPYVEPPGPETIKECSVCKRKKQRRFFYKQTESVDGRRPECIKCYDEKYRVTKTPRDHLELRKWLKERKKNGRSSDGLRDNKEHAYEREVLRGLELRRQQGDQGSGEAGRMEGRQEDQGDGGQPIGGDE